MARTKDFNWVPGLFIITYHVMLLIGLPLYLYMATPSYGLAAATFALLYLTGLSITGGYHRYYAHRSYRTNTFVEAILLFFGSMSAQGSALRWAFEHRLHHAYTDGDRDPYSIKRGFWYAHFLWLFEKPEPIQPKVVQDLLRNRMVVFQDRHVFSLLVITNAMAIAAVAWLCDDFWGAFIIAGLLRMFLLHHFTWFINSLAHCWGSRYFCQELTAVDNYVLSFLTFGEGYHNYHHAYANDYRNGIRWYHFDPTKWLIWSLSKLGLAHDLKRTDPLTIQKRIVMERRNLLMDRVKDLWYVKKDELEAQIQEISNSIFEHIAALRELHTRYLEFQSECVDKAIISDLYDEMCRVKQNIKEDWRRWCVLSKGILHLKPLSV